MSVVLVRGDARELSLPDESVDLVVTSPPYFGQRDYRDNGQSMAGQIGSEETPREYIAALLDCTREWMRVLKPTGSLFVNLGDKYSQRTQIRRSSHQPGIFPGKFEEFGESWAERARKGAVRMPHQNVINDDGDAVLEKSLMQLPQRYSIGCTDQLGLILRRDIIWRKLSATPESAEDRCATRHEYLYHLTKCPRYFSATDDIREPHAEVSLKRSAPHRANPGRASREGRTYAGTGMHPQSFQVTQMTHPLGKMPGSVWDIAPTPLLVPDHIAHSECCGGRKRPGCDEGLEHHAAFPFELARKCILGWSPASGIVADPFGGSGTVALVADVLGRTGISSDLSAGYCRIAQWRTTDPGERSRAMQVPKPPPVIDGQESLFEVGA